jgi:tetratricopeptide (TPR) repeat protein
MSGEDIPTSPFRAPTDPVEAVLQRAWLHAQDEAWEEAAARLREGLEAHPGDPYLLCWLGLAERELGMEGIAYERFKQALVADIEDPVLLATAGNALAAFDDPAAEGALRTAALLAPALPQARWMYGAYLAREGMSKEALVELDAAAALDPMDPVIQLERGVALALAGDLEGAGDAFAASAGLDPEDGWSLVLLGLARFLAGDPEESLRALESGARNRPEDLDAQLLASLAFSALGWEDRAWEFLERARVRADAEDLPLVAEAEGPLEEGGEAALGFLRESLAPSSFRERLLQRP